ncbi:MAG: DUF2461 domain-containing protein [Mariprofundaceae bacterium]|nr:DUF2461 domain-containing protein [Mariprofundaceae bacterium]
MSEFFSENTFSFLKELAANNNRGWFNDNKERYESVVREPALAFIRAMAPELARFAPHFVAIDRKMGGSLMRVHRDIRYSRNKMPYKTNIGIQFRHELGKDVHAPGFYFHIEAHEVFVGAGIWHPDSETLKKIRTYIDAHPTRWQDGRDNAGFAKAYALAGDSLQRAPKGYAPEHPMIEDLKRKDFIGIAPLMPELLLQDDLVGLISSYFETATPFMQQLCRAVGVQY